jgi:hypothetical protein
MIERGSAACFDSLLTASQMDRVFGSDQARTCACDFERRGGQPGGRLAPLEREAETLLLLGVVCMVSTRGLTQGGASSSPLGRRGMAVRGAGTTGPSKPWLTGMLLVEMRRDPKSYGAPTR